MPKVNVYHQYLNVIGLKKFDKKHIIDKLTNRADLKICLGESKQYSGVADQLKLDIFGFKDVDNSKIVLVAKELAKHKIQIGEKVKKAILKCNKQLNLDHINIFLFPSISSFAAENLNGVCGYVFDEYTLFLSIAPKSKWKSEISKIVAHEYAHNVRWHCKEYALVHLSLLSQLISEGLAEHFKQQVFKCDADKYAAALTTKQEREVWKMISNKLDSHDDDFLAAVIFGSWEQRIPHWAGYTIGYNIVRDYLKKNKTTAAKSMLIPSKEIFRKSGYCP